MKRHKAGIGILEKHVLKNTSTTSEATYKKHTLYVHPCTNLKPALFTLPAMLRARVYVFAHVCTCVMLALAPSLFQGLQLRKTNTLVH